MTPPSFSQSLNTVTDDKDEENLFIMGMDDKSDEGETTPLVIIQEDIGAVASSPMPQAKMRLLNDDDLEIASDDDKYDDEKYDDDGGWEDMYEQEIWSERVTRKELHILHLLMVWTITGPMSFCYGSIKMCNSMNDHCNKVFVRMSWECRMSPICSIIVIEQATEKSDLK